MRGGPARRLNACFDGYHAAVKFGRPKSGGAQAPPREFGDRVISVLTYPSIRRLSCVSAVTAEAGVTLYEKAQLYDS